MFCDRVCVVHSDLKKNKGQVLIVEFILLVYDPYAPSLLHPIYFDTKFFKFSAQGNHLRKCLLTECGQAG